MKTIEIGKIITFELITDQPPDKIEFEVFPTISLFLDDKLLFSDNVNHDSSTRFTYSFQPPSNSLVSDHYRVVWDYSFNNVKPPEKDRTEYFGVTEYRPPNFVSFEENPYLYLINLVRTLVYDQNVPIEMFSINRQNSTESFVKVFSDRIIGSNDGQIEFELKFNENKKIIDLINAIDEISGWFIITESEFDPERLSDELRATTKQPAANSVTISANHFFTNFQFKQFIDESITQFNKDWKTCFTITDFPYSFVYILEFLIASKALLIRSLRDVKALSQFLEEGRITSIGLGGKLQVGFDNDFAAAKPQMVRTWFDLSKYYKQLYENEVDKHGVKSYPNIVPSNRLYINTKTGRKPYWIDPGLEPLKKFKGEIVKYHGNLSVKLTWHPIYDRDFQRYIILKSDNKELLESDLLDGNFTNSKFKWKEFFDNHANLAIDNEIDTISYYALILQNMNGLFSKSEPEIVRVNAFV